MSVVRQDKVSSPQSKLSELSKPTHRKPRIQLLAAALGVLPLYSALMILELRSDRQLSVQAFILYLAVISPLAIVIALLLLRFLCGENPRDLNLRPGKLPSDLLTALILSIVIIVASVISTHFLAELLPESGSDTSVGSFFAALASNHWLLVLFAGPLFFSGAASEEVVRVFLLSRVWKVWPAILVKLLFVVVSACLFGLVHLYQGPVHVAWTAIFGLIAALYYLRFGRVAPLILAHYLTNALQVVVFAVRAS